MKAIFTPKILRYGARSVRWHVYNTETASFPMSGEFGRIKQRFTDQAECQVMCDRLNAQHTAKYGGS